MATRRPSQTAKSDKTSKSGESNRVPDTRVRHPMSRILRMSPPLTRSASTRRRATLPTHEAILCLHPDAGAPLEPSEMPHIVSSRPEDGLGLAVQRDNRDASHGEPSDQRRQRLVRPIAVAAPDMCRRRMSILKPAERTELPATADHHLASLACGRRYPPVPFDGMARRVPLWANAGLHSSESAGPC